MAKAITLKSGNTVVYPVNKATNTYLRDNSTSVETALENIEDEIDDVEREVKSIAIRGAGAPTTSTVGSIGTLYESTTDGKIYKCTAISGNTYTWTEIGSGGGSAYETITETASPLPLTSIIRSSSNNSYGAGVYVTDYSSLSYLNSYNVQLQAFSTISGTRQSQGIISVSAKPNGANVGITLESSYPASSAGYYNSTAHISIDSNTTYSDSSIELQANNIHFIENNSGSNIDRKLTFETWTFTLEDGTTVTKNVFLGQVTNH